MDGTVCVTCGKPLAYDTVCYRCGQPVHLQEPACGSWILDSWHPMAFDEVDGNEFWCQECLNKGYSQEDE